MGSKKDKDKKKNGTPSRPRKQGVLYDLKINELIVLAVTVNFAMDALIILILVIEFIL